MPSTDYRIPLGRGRTRSVLVRPTDRDRVQLGILSVYGNVLELVDLDPISQGALVGALSLAREDADRSWLDRLSAARLDGEARLRAAHARNPYLNGAHERAHDRARRRRGAIA